MKTSLKFLVCSAVLSALLFFDFFYINNFNAYPWWHLKGNDIDGAYTATTAGLLNGTELDFVYHPGATIFTIHGTVYRAGNLADLSEVKDINDAVAILDRIVRTSRVVQVVLSAILGTVFFGFLFALSGHLLLSFLFAYYVVSSPAFLEHVYMVRAEMPNLIFFYGALWGLCVYIRRKKTALKKFVPLMAGIGFLIGLSIFSKIQIGPAVLATALATAVYFFLNGERGKTLLQHPKAVWTCLGVSLLNCMVMPWWTFQRPVFLNDEYFRVLHRLSPLRYVYGLAPESFLPPILVAAVLLAGISAGMIFWQRSGRQQELMRRVFPLALTANAMVLGGILSVYVTLIPASVSFSQYLDNTQHLVYSVLTNVVYGKFLTHRVFNETTFVKIWEMHGSRTLLLEINLLIIVAVGAGVSVWRAAVRPVKEKWPYLLVLLLLGTGFGSDVLAAMHWKNIRYYHAIYSLCLYVSALLLLISLEIGRFKKENKTAVVRALYYGAILLLGAHAVLTTLNIIRQPRASGQSDQDPAVEFLNVKTLAQPYWRVVNENIQKNMNHAQ